MDEMQVPGIIASTIEEIEEKSIPEYSYLFTLIGHIRRTKHGLRQQDRRQARAFADIARKFAQEILTRGLGGNRINWADTDAVLLEFETAWMARRLPKNTNFFETAIELSIENILELPSERNYWVNRVANVAFCLGELLPDTPILIPVSDRTAAMLGTSLRTLSLALREAIRERLVLVIGKADPRKPVRQARRLKFNSKHPLVANDIERYRKAFKALVAERLPKDYGLLSD